MIFRGLQGVHGAGDNFEEDVQQLGRVAPDEQARASSVKVHKQELLQIQY